MSATQSGGFQASELIWSGRVDPDGNAPIWLRCKGFTNWGSYCNPKIDEQFDLGSAAQTLADRLPFYKRATDMFLADQPDVVLYHSALLWGVSAKLQGFRGRPDGLWRPEGVTMAP